MRSSRRRISPAVIVFVAAAAVATTGLVLWDRAAPRLVPDARDPAVRARAAAQSITGQQTVRRVEVEPGRVVVHAASKYYDPRASAAANREYLATEGRLMLQLILNDVPELMSAQVQLYSGRRRLAVIRGHPGQAYEEYTVSYDAILSE